MTLNQRSLAPFVAVLLFLVFLLPTSSIAAEKQARTISVTGDAEVHIRPDLLSMSLGIRKFDPDVKKAFMQTNDVIREIIKIAKRYGISEDYIQTSQLELIPEREYARGERGVGVSRVVQILVHNPVPIKMDEMLMEMILSGSNTVIDFEYKTTELQKYRNEARTLAMQNAQTRARSILEPTSTTLGEPITIREDSFRYYPYYRRYRGWWDRGSRNSSDMFMSQMVSSHLSDSGSGDEDSGGTSIAMGLLVVQTSVSVTFELD